MTSDSVVAPRGALVAHALQDVAVGHAGGGEEDVLALDEVVVGEHALEVVAGVHRGLALVVVARPQAPDLPAADALDRRGGDDALGRAADAPQEVDRGARGDRQQRRGDVAVGDQAHARAGVADRLDALLVARAVEHDDHHVADVDLARSAISSTVFAERRGRGRAGRRSPRRRPSSPCTRTGPGRTSCRARRARSRRSRSACRARTGACPRAGRRRCRPGGRSRRRRARRCASIGASSFSPSPMTTMPSIAHGAQHGVHAVDGGLVGGDLVAAADPAGGLQRGGLGDADELEREVAIGR